MPTIQFGSESEFVRISLRNPYLAEGWCQASVEIVVPGFSGHIEPWLEAGDFESFYAELEQLYKSLKGEARLHPREEQFTLLIQAKAAGHITVSGVAWSQATFGNKLAFAIELDQSYLPNTLSQLADATSAR